MQVPPMAKIQSIRFLASDSGHMEEEKKFLFSLVAWGQGFTCRNSCINSGYFSFIFRTFLLTKFITCNICLQHLLTRVQATVPNQFIKFDSCSFMVTLLGSSLVSAVDKGNLLLWGESEKPAVVGNQTHGSWVELPVLSPLDNRQPSQSSICNVQVVLNASVTHLATGGFSTFLYFAKITLWW